MKDLIKKVIFYDYLPEFIKNGLRRLSLRSPRARARVSYRVTDLEIPVLVYFDGNMGHLYQIEQWIQILKELNKKAKVYIVIRKISTFNWLKNNTDFPIFWCKTLDDLQLFYQNDIKCILYVNHTQSNFQSLINGKSLHVHINHGESDKTSTITNQSQAYNYVFVSAEAAYEKYDNNLIKKEMGKFIKVGRPQLDHIGVPIEVETDKKVILYAPTWEGTHESMNFSSLKDFGIDLVKNILGNSEYYLLYKPHPNTGSRNAKYGTINQEIIEIINSSEYGEVFLTGDINKLYDSVNLAIFDNSAVAIDYLASNKPMLMTDLFHVIQERVCKPTICGAARMLEIKDVDNICNIIENELNDDTFRLSREEIRKYFIGDYSYKENKSTEVFIENVLNVISERDRLITQLST